MRRLIVASVLMVAASLAGCPPSGGPDSGTAADGGDGDGDPDGGAVVDAGLDLTRDPACDKGEWIVLLRGRAVDGAGEVPAGARMQTCVRGINGILTCLQPQQLAADGSYEVLIPESVRCVDTMTARLFVPDANMTTGYCHLDLEPNAPIQEFDQPFKVYATTPAATLPALGTPEDAREVVFANGLTVELTPSVYYADRGPNSSDPSYNHLAVASFEGAALDDLCFLEESPPMLTVFGFSPEGDLGERAPFRYGPTELAEGTELPLYALGGLSCSVDEESIAEGDWEQFGAGTVDAEGYVVADAVNGVPCLIWMGIGAPEQADAGN